MVVLTALLSLLAAPAAQAHFEPSSLARPVPGAAALAASTKIEFERAPREVHGQCATTEAIAGLGNACATSGGLFRLKLRDGSSLTTHGFDGPQPDAFNTYMTGSSQALSNASVNNIECVNAATTKHTTLIYAYPPGQSSRYGTIAPLLRTESYKMSAFLDAESRSVDASKGLKIPLECDGSGTPVVLEVQTATPTGSDSFDSIVSDLRADGYGASTSLVAKDRYVVFYDASIGNGYAGTGHLYADDTPSSSSYNNVGGMFAVEFNWANVPHWDVMLHEAGHNMGAVQASAPRTSGNGHCTDGQDIMCYADGGPNAYNPNVCAVEVFDCGRNDYFNPTPAAGSYLDTHWNTAAPYNQYLLHVNLNDTTAPTAPSNLTQGNESDTASALYWTASTDAIGVTGYHIWRSDNAGGWTLAGTAPYNQTYYAVGNLAPNSSYDVAVSAFDASNNESAKGLLTIATNSTPDTTPPTQASSLNAAAVTMNSVRLMWAPASDNIGVAGYIVYRDYGSGNTGELGKTTTNSLDINGLLPASAYVLGVAAYDNAGHQSTPAWITAVTAADAEPPTSPLRLHIARRARKSVTLVWSPSSDNIGVTRYFIYRWNGHKWALTKTTRGGIRKVAVHGLRRRRRYHFIMRAGDQRGNYSSWSNQTAATTRR